MGYIYDDWKKLLETYQQCVEKGLDEIHQQKAEVQQIKVDIFNRLDKGVYYHDNDRIVISAPEIIIGNVDKSGDLQGGVGRVVVKGSDLSFEGVGETGSIVSRAPSIRQVAVDPGIDGVENVVCDTSEIISQAGSVLIHGSKTDGVFPQTIESAGKGGVFIHADRDFHLEAASSAEVRKNAIENEVEVLTQQAGDLKKAMDKQKKSMDRFFTRMNKLHEQEEKLNVSEGFSLRIHLADIDELHKEMNALLPALYRSTIDYMQCVSKLAEVNRKKKALEDEKGAIKTGDDFKKNSTGASMAIKAENIRIETADGDGNLRTNPDAGIAIHTPRIGVSMSDDAGKLIENSSFVVNAENISLTSVTSSDDAKEMNVTGKLNIQSKEVNIEAIDYMSDDKGIKEKELSKEGKVSITAKTVELSTANPTNIKVDDEGKVTGGEYKAEGDVIIKSKTISMETLDYEVKDGKLEKKALTKDSRIALRAEKMDMLAADTEGKATGSISLNAKAVAVKSMDVDKEKLTDSALAAGSTMTLVSEKMYVGSKSKDVKSKKLQAVSEELGLFADNTFEAQQGDGKAVVQLAGGNASVGGSKSQIYGETAINGKTEVKGDLKAPKGQFDNLEAKSSFKSQNISDGIAVPGAAAGGSLSAKLKTEDAPKEG